MNNSFEIGVVYRKNSRLFLAVSDRVLVGFKDGKCSEVRPYVKYEAVRGISVEEFCQQAGITLEDLDKVTAKWLAPSPEGLKTRPRGSRRQKSADEFAWRSLRLIRLSVAS